MSQEKTMLEKDENISDRGSEKDRTIEDNRSTKDTLLSNGGTD